MHKVYFCFLFSILMLLMSCNKYKYLQLSEDPISEKYPCEIKFVKELSDNKRYKLIGACKTKGTSNSSINGAMKMLKKCACKHGGDVVKIINHKEKVGVAPPLDSRQIFGYDPFLLVVDILVGEVYVSKSNNKSS